jgi:hypothetical protein
MRFEYTAILSTAPDTGDPLIIFRPEVPLRVHGPHGSRDFLALVDTGADNTILPASVARELSIPLAPGQGPGATAFGGQRMALSYADVDLELVLAGGRLRWSARVFFVDASDGDDETVLLGHQGFLDYFTARFIGEECALELEPNSYLPQPIGRC